MTGGTPHFVIRHERSEEGSPCVAAPSFCHPRERYKRGSILCNFLLHRGDRVKCHSCPPCHPCERGLPKRSPRCFSDEKLAKCPKMDPCPCSGAGV
ncbi:MAG: hypothetical protein AAF471_07545, partial [Myxococcota bacterium]